MIGIILSLPVMAMAALWFHDLGLHTFAVGVWIAAGIILLKANDIFNQAMQYRTRHRRRGRNEHEVTVVYIYEDGAR